MPFGHRASSHFRDPSSTIWPADALPRLADKAKKQDANPPLPRYEFPRRIVGAAICLFALIGFSPGIGAVAAAPLSGSATCGAGTGGGRSFAGQDLSNHNFHADPQDSLIGADFSNAQLSGAIFTGQNLTSAKFQGANLGPSKGPVDFANASLTNTCFVGANLDQTDFSGAQITCADFSGTSLIHATFGPTQNIVMGAGCRTKFNGATLDVHMISNDPDGKSNWSKSDFTSANFQNLSSSTFNLIGKDISGAMLAQTNFTGIDMTGANLTDVDFSHATLTKAVLNNAAINGAKFYNAQAQSISLVCAQAYGNAGGKTKPDSKPCAPGPTSADPNIGADFRLAALKNADFTAATMDHATFPGGNLTGATFDNASLVQAILQSDAGHIGPAIVQFASFQGVDFSNAQLSNVNLSGSNLRAAVFDSTTLYGTSFTNATLSDARFQSSTLQSVDFSGARLQSSKFRDAKIQAPGDGAGFGANFSCAQLGGADFANATIAATNFSNAVMPAEHDCCPATDGGDPWCGIVDATQKPYGPVTFPVLNSIATCPNGSTAQCTGSQWQLSPNWQTTSCNANGTPQQMWSHPNCGGQPGEIVTFKDANLKSCILETLPRQTDVLLATAQQITQVNCSGRDIKDISGLENFISLVKLDLSSNALPIFTLAFTSGGKPAPSNLRTLALDNNALTTLDLSNHPALVSLSVSNNKLKSIAYNANTYLLVLDASHNELTSPDLPIQTSLAYADLSYNALTNVLDSYHNDLSGLTSLAFLDVSHNNLPTIGSISAIASCVPQIDSDCPKPSSDSLQSLFLACNPKFRCGELGVYNGTQFPAAATSSCSAYNTGAGKWTPLTNPTCPPG
jgi:uncharacterized protein YjbI with pentapeptide repeats